MSEHAEETPHGSSDQRWPDRAESRRRSELALMEAALDLLRRDGVLAGLNMKEVADEAGVNRGLIHRYFGSRRDLLLSALEKGLESTLEGHQKARPLAPLQKALDQFRAGVEISDWTRIVTLLALDGEDSFDAIPFGEDRIEDALREQSEGAFDEDVDIPIALLEWDASLLGYAILRRAASRQLEIPLDELDRRMLNVLRRYAVANGPPSDSSERRSATPPV